MRSASMPLFGFDETRMSASRSPTPALRPAGFHGAERSRQALLEALRRAFRPPQPLDDEDANALLHLRARLAVGAQADVIGEVDLGWFVEEAVEEEVNGASYIVTAHQISVSFRWSGAHIVDLNCDIARANSSPIAKKAAARRPPLSTFDV